jgi:SHS2 domain-containing protein
MQAGFEYLDHTSDILVRAHGGCLAKAFEQSARALTKVVVRNPEAICRDSEKNINISAETLVELLYRFLEELIFLFDTEKLVFAEFNIVITELDSKIQLKARLFGERLNVSRHITGIEVKAITFHLMKIYRANKIWWSEFLLDI